jgi:hypothetical protein
MMIPAGGGGGTIPAMSTSHHFLRGNSPQNFWVFPYSIPI